MKAVGDPSYSSQLLGLSGNGTRSVIYCSPKLLPLLLSVLQGAYVNGGDLVV